MATYELPTEPDVDTIWTTYSPGASRPTVTTRWTRLPDEASIVLWIGPEGQRLSWAEVLAEGVVHDQHPDLCGLPDLPWKWDDENHVIRNRRFVAVLFLEEDGVGPAIVRAVNEHAARVTGQDGA